MNLFLVRHAESQFNEQGRVQGQLDPPLSALGHRQAVALAQALAELAPEVILSSPLRRAYDTALVVAQKTNAPLEVLPELKELNAGIFQGRLWSELEAAFPQQVARWRSGDPDFVIPGGESRRMLMQRGWAALQRIHQMPYQRVAVIAPAGLWSNT